MFRCGNCGFLSYEQGDLFTEQATLCPCPTPQRRATKLAPIEVALNEARNCYFSRDLDSLERLIRRIVKHQPSGASP